MRKLLILVLLCSLTACATTENVYSIAAKTLLNSRQAVIAGATVTDTLCKQKVLKVDDCTKAAVMYEQAKASYALASDAFVLAVQSGNSADWSAYLIKEADYKTVAGSAIACYQAFTGGEK